MYRVSLTAKMTYERSCTNNIVTFRKGISHISQTSTDTGLKPEPNEH